MEPPALNSTDTRRTAALLVEDEPAHATLIGETLRRLVDHVEHVESGADAFSALTARRFELVILDLNLPDVSGITVLKWMRGRDDLTPVIFVTVEDDVERGVEAMRLLATNYVPKRLGYLDKVIAAVMEVLSQPVPNGAVPSAGNDQAAQAHAARGVFRREGEYWTIAYGGTVCRLKDTRGLRYLAYLLFHPGQEYAAIDLLATAGGVVEGPSPSSKTLPPGEGQVRTTLGDGLGPLLDSTARAQCRAKLAELRERAAEAERLNDPLRAARAREESEAIKSHLRAALGLGGRPRRAGSPAERARLAVTKGIKSVIEKIREADPALGRHLAAHVKTGYLCAYVPNPDHPVSWET